MKSICLQELHDALFNVKGAIKELESLNDLELQQIGLEAQSLWEQVSKLNDSINLEDKKE